MYDVCRLFVDNFNDVSYTYKQTNTGGEDMAFIQKYDYRTEPMTVRVPSDLHDQLKTRAAEEGKSKSEKLVEILQDELGTEKRPPAGNVFG